MRSGVYAIVNSINGNMYIGSSVNLRKRKREHFYYLKHNIHHSYYLQRSYNKHGKEAFDFIIKEYCLTNKLIEIEQRYIDELRPKYNICKIAGNSIGVNRTNETIQKLRESHLGQVAWNKGIPQSIEQRLAHSKRMTGRVSGAKGKKWSKESKDKLSITRTGKPANNRKTVMQFDCYGNFIAQFASIMEAEIKTGTNGIHQVLRGRCKTANNFIWKLKQESRLQ